MDFAFLAENTLFPYLTYGGNQVGPHLFGAVTRHFEKGSYIHRAGDQGPHSQSYPQRLRQHRLR